MVTGWSWRRRVKVPRQASGEEEVEEDDGDGEDDADEAFGEDVEGAGGGEAVAADAETVLETHVSKARHGAPGFRGCSSMSSSSVRQKE